ncbi:MAG: SPOR domain-containing protein [Pseudomonadota bacterium]
MKERLIGAVVLVTVAWLLIPVFLDGSPDAPDALTTRTVNLPGVDDPSSDTDDQMRTITLRSRESAAPEQALTEPPVEIELPAPERTVERVEDTDDPVESLPDDVGLEAQTSPNIEPEPETEAEIVADVEPKPEVSPPPAVVTSQPTQADTSTSPDTSTSQSAELWVVQVGSFGQRSNAETLMKKLIAAGFPAFVSEIQTSGGTMHRVRVGPQKNRAASDDMVTKLKSAGQNSARSVPYP